MIKLLMFDLDGTLIDSAPDIINAANILLERRGYAKLPDETIIAAIGHGMSQLIFKLLPEAQRSEETLKELTREYVAIYREHLIDRTKVFDGVVDFLKANNRKIAVVTNKNESVAREIIKQLELGQFEWSSIIGGTTFANPKPHPQPFLEAIKAAGVTKEEAVMIGDGLPDIEGAKNAGVRCIGIDFGYTKPELLRNAGAEHMISSFAQLEAKLNELDSRS